MAVKSVLGLFDGPYVPHRIATNRPFGHEVSEVPVGAIQKLAKLLRFQPLLLLLSIEPCCEEVESSLQFTDVRHCCGTFVGSDRRQMRMLCHISLRSFVDLRGPFAKGNKENDP
jgi:hypothetical protein